MEEQKMAALIACIGSGNMGNALMRGAAKSGVSVGFADADREKAEAAARAVDGNVFDTNTAAAEAGDFVFLAVKPQVMAKVLEEIAPVLAKRALAGNPAVIVSMAAGWTTGKIISLLEKHSGAPGFTARVIRIMPNTPALIAKGMIALCASPEVPPERLDAAEKILVPSGIVDRLPEQYLDAVTGLSGSGPAFVYMFIEALADGGVLAGLPRDRALRYAAQTVLGGAAMVLETGRHPGALKDDVCSPGGTTIAGVAALERGAFRAAVSGAVEAAWRRAGELG
jgi:pyrroline-5-carboxylate reductase